MSITDPTSRREEGAVRLSSWVRRWYVTSPHRVARMTSAGWLDVPFGTGHMRQVGAALTACGEYAQNWPIFWDLGSEQVEDLCPECHWIAGSTP